MAATVTQPIASHRPLTPPPDNPQLSLKTSHPASAPIPNKRLPFCPAGPPVHHGDCELSTPPDTPPSKEPSLKSFALLQSAQSSPKLSDQPPIYSVKASDLVLALDEAAHEPFPDPRHTFPWLHGLHEENKMQLAFFAARRGIQRDTPKCFNWITIVKCGGDMSSGCLKGATSPEEILDLSSQEDVAFLDVDPKEGFGIRNFHIQMAKIAKVSDIVIYRDETETEDSTLELAKCCAIAQNRWRKECDFGSDEFAPEYNTFVLSESFEQMERTHSGIVAKDSIGDLNAGLDFSQIERQEMCRMTTASEISHNVWLGPTPDLNQSICSKNGQINFEVLIETNDVSPPPDSQTLRYLRRQHSAYTHTIGFPSSGSILPQSWPKGRPDPLSTMCQWIYEITNCGDDTEEENLDLRPGHGNDIPMRDLSPRSRKVLLHCTDGYTETTLLALAYFMYAEQVPLHEALLKLHAERQRNFFAYPSDIALLQSLEPCLMNARKQKIGKLSRALVPQAPPWLSRMDGSLPSRILPYLYLGNLTHANNPDLLKALGIGQVLSVGEPVNWIPSSSTGTRQDAIKVMFVDRIQDNGVDPLTSEFERCLDFIAEGKAKGIATLVHCRVGVSRSATICIAEVMVSMGLSFPRAYCLVRARRLNVIIQPHLLFVYELMRFDERCQQQRGEKARREMEWTDVCREIARMNKPYCSR